MEAYVPLIQYGLTLIIGFGVGAAAGILRVGRVIQRVDHISATQKTSDERNDTAHGKLFDGIDLLRRDVNGNIGKLNTGLARVGTTVETLPCRPQGHRPPDDCPGGS